MICGKIASAEAGKPTNGADTLKRAAQALAGKRTLVAGLARTGVSVARFLKKCGAVVAAYDALPVERLAGAGELSAIGVDIKAGGAKADTRGVELVVVSPGVPHDMPLLNEARSSGAEVISEIELAYRFMDCPVLAVAGTNGKTTTTTLLATVLEEAGRKVFVGGNIGTPAIEYIESGGGAELCVLEVSSFHLETTESFNPKVGILLNITDDHLDRYRDFGHYAETKFRLFENQREGDFAVVNAADPVIAARARAWPGRGRVVPFTTTGALSEGLWLDGDNVVYSIDGTRELYPVSSFRLKGLHNMENIMAVIAAARLMGIPCGAITGTLKTFGGLAHRMEPVRVLGGVTYMDDSKGTNTGALMMALKGTPAPVILIAGGKDKGGDYGVLSNLVKEKVKLMVLIGEARFKIKDALGPLAETVLAGTLEEAVRLSHERAKAGDTVLLCPACSSFDMFRDYKERGERFKAAVAALP
ncbi:MAG: UDP-N-acetylmuramoyl-L-alanine--D-glutamate ligase [Deltaproteobacteria bacterium]|nr:UDP-N-acetylmuramoyl-L-alanine--D-glutamate ligase [Deltaproteobacteria bacterium]